MRPGQKVPDFTLPDLDGNVRSLSEFTSSGGALLAFFPFAFSGTCDKEMCAFRDNYPSLGVSGVKLVGVSVDSTYSLKAFAQTYDLTFPLLSDFNKKTSRLFGVLQDKWVGLGYKGVAKRSLFLVDRGRTLRYRWVTDVPSEEPPCDQAVEAARELAR